MQPPPAEPPGPEPVPKTAVAPPAAQEHFTNLIAIVPDQTLAPDDVIPPASELANTAFGAEKGEGDVPLAPVATPITAASAAEQPGTNKAAVYEMNAVEEAALFPGGTEAFGRYLAKALGTPEGLEQGETRTAKVEFVISKDGTVLAIGVLQSAGAGLDALIVQALSRSPRWKPARQHGAAVPVRFTLPVTFVGPEE